MGVAVFIGLAHLVAAVACWIAWRFDAINNGPADTTGPRSWPWLLMAAILAVTAVGRTMNIDYTTADLGRELAASRGLYDIRQPFQVALGLALLILWAAVVRALFRRHRRRGNSYLPTAIVISSLIALEAVRSVSLHVVDSALNRVRILDVKMGDWLEISAALLTVSLAARSALSAQATNNGEAGPVRSEGHEKSTCPKPWQPRFVGPAGRGDSITPSGTHQPTDQRDNTKSA